MARDSGGAGPVRALIFLALAIGAGSFSLVMLYKLITSYQLKIDEAKRPEDTVMVIVAARDLYQGVTITEEDLYAVQIPPKYLPEGVFLSPEHVVGRIPRERILANEFVRADRLADPESGVGLNAVIPRGMRAISINISDGSAVSGFLNPGNYVDVLVTIEGDEAREAETNTLLQAVTVLAVNNRLGNTTSESSDRGKASVTVAVTPDLAEKLTHAVAQGTVTMTLRNDIDVTHVETHGAFASSLLGGATDEKRITVKEWTERRRESADGTVTIIQGRDQRTEKTRGQ